MTRPPSEWSGLAMVKGLRLVKYGVVRLISVDRQLT